MERKIVAALVFLAAPQVMAAPEIRKGSTLQSDEALSAAVIPDRRGPLQSQRDALIYKHTTRLAWLDALLAKASADDDAVFAERIEVLRKKELKWYRTVMMRIKRHAISERLSGTQK